MAIMRPTLRQKKEALAISKGRCIFCGAEFDIELHHNIRRRFGIHANWNLWPLCKAHHRQMMHHHRRDGAPFTWPTEEALAQQEAITLGLPAIGIAVDTTEGGKISSSSSSTGGTGSD